MFATITYPLVMVVSRRLLKSDSTLSVLLYGNLILLSTSAMMLPALWTTPTAEDLWLFLFMGLIDWALILSAIIWSELRDLITWAGFVIIVTAGLASCRSEIAPGNFE